MEAFMHARKLVLFALLAAGALLVAGCAVLDVVGRTAVTTFQTLLETTAGSVTMDAATNRWVLASQGGETFEWSADFSGTPPSFRLSLDAAPFLAAGLDAARLPAPRYSHDAVANRLTLSFDVGKDRFTYNGLAYNGLATPLETFKKIVRTHRPIIGYHAALDHYGIALGDGNMFEWAKDMVRNDKDMVFVLNPEPLLAAGVDPSKIAGWIFTKIPVKDESGKTVDVDKFVKPYDLK
jgi:hypothetical protein